jgi:DNA invertase Pin-like site-specific DNA recombinase
MNNLQIVKTHCDEGESGLRSRTEPACDNSSPTSTVATPPSATVLVYDVSRWGRFQDTDESAHYEFVCRQVGVPVAYCAEQFDNDGSMLSSIVKNLKRVMAAEYSRDLSKRVHAGQSRTVQNGFRDGAPVTYALRRELVDAHETESRLRPLYKSRSLRQNRSRHLKYAREAFLHRRFSRKGYEVTLDGKRSPPMNSTPDGKATESDDISIVPSRLPLRGGSALRGLVGLLLAVCIFAAAFVSQSSHGGAAKQIIAQWAPRLVSTSLPPPNEPEFGARPNPFSPQMVAAEPMPLTLSAQKAPQELGPTAAPLSPELAQRLQTMASDLSNAEHEIEQLKTRQEQMARDNASAIEQLKASQEQTARDNAKTGEQLKATREQIVNFIAALSEQNLEPKTTAPRSRPTDTSTRKPAWKRPSPQARVQP